MDRINGLRIMLAAFSAEDRRVISSLIQDESLHIVNAFRPDDDGVKKARMQQADVLLIGTSSIPDAELDFAEQVYPLRSDITILLLAPKMEANTIARAMESGISRIIDIAGGAGVICNQILTVANREQNRRGSIQKMANYDSKIVACYSPKGGSGKTTLSVNIACALAALNKKVALIDMDLQFGNVGVFLDITPGDTIADMVNERSFELAIIKSYLIRHQSGVMVMLASSSPEYAELIRPEHIETILATLKTEFDYVILDMGTALGDCAIAALEKADTILFVVNEDFAALHDAKRSIGVLEALNVQDKIQVIVNKDGISTIKPMDIKSLLNVSPRLVVPYDINAAMMAVNRGMPMTTCAPESKAVRAINAYARNLAQGA